jgi:SAM-dependent methyltransferase
MTYITSSLQVDPSNAEMAKAWDGDEGSYWAAHAGHFDRAVAAYHEKFLDVAAIGPGEQVLDIGCGTGQTTRDAARRASSGGALGVDLSSQMIALARRLAAAEGLGNARFEQADAQIYPFGEGSFDVAISRTGAMFFGNPHAAFGNIARALRGGGRLALLSWQPAPANEWVAEFTAALAAGRDLPAPAPGSPGPFALADPDRVRQLLAGTGFTDIEADPVQAPMWFGADADDGYALVLGLLGWMLEGLDDGRRTQALGALWATVAAHQTTAGVVYDSAAWLVRARRAQRLRPRPGGG